MNYLYNQLPYQQPYHWAMPTCYCNPMSQALNWQMPYQYNGMHPWAQQMNMPGQHYDLSDQGGKPFVINIEEAAERNNTFRTALWTGNHLQVTLMSIGVGDDIGLENHHDTDQFLRIEEGEGLVQMGESEHQLHFERRVKEDSAIFVPAGIWHNLTNTGNKPLKLYSIYAPPEHPFGTVHLTKEEAIAAESMHE